MKKENFSPRVMAEVALLSAFAVVLDLLQSAICRFFPLWPNGGSIGIAMVPIFILAYRRGTICGLLGGFIVGLLDMLDGVDISPLATNGWMVFASVLLDYVLAWTLVGCSGLMGSFVRKAKTKKEMWLYASLGVVIGGGLRFISHFLSGMYMWEKGTEVLHIALDVPKYAYSLLYNGSYLLPCIIICAVVVSLLLCYQPKLLVNNENLIVTKEAQDEEKN